MAKRKMNLKIWFFVHILVITAWLLGSVIQTGAQIQKTITGQNDPGVDPLALQAAVAEGETIDSEETFDFEEEGSVNITEDVNTVGEADSIIIRASAFPVAGGSISPSGKVAVNPGDNLQFIITPNTGYKIKNIIVDGVPQGAVNIYTFINITKKHSIKAKFAKPKFTVMIARGGNVSVSPVGKQRVTYGKIIKLKIKPKSEDVVPILLVNGQQVDATKFGKIYKFDLTVVGDTSVYATSEVEPVLTAATKIIDEPTLQNLTSISDDGSVLTFNGVTPYLESLQPGDVIISSVTEATPYGLLRKVTNVTIAGSQVTVETTEGTLEDAIEEAEVIMNQALTANKIARFVPLVEGVTLQEAIPGSVQPQACLSLDNVLYDVDGNENTTNDQIALKGSACLNPTFRCAIGIKMDWWPYPKPVLKNLVFAVGISENIALELVANYAYSFSKEVPVATIEFEPIIAGYFVFLPVLTVYVGINGSLSAGITANVAQNTGLEVGLQYSHGNWSPIHNFTSGFDYNLPSLSTLWAQAKVYAKPQFDLLLYGIAGPYADIEGYFDLTMDPFGDPWLTLWGGMLPTVGVTAKLFGKTLFDYDLPLPDYREKIVELAGNKPPTITSFTASPTKVFTGDTSTVTLVASDPEGDSLTCTWSTNGGSLSSTTGCGSVTWTAPGTIGTYTVSVSVTDNWPGHSPVTRGIPIDVDQNLPPIITSLTPSNPSVILGGASTVTLVASDPEGDPLACTWSTNGGSLSSTTDCSSVAWTAPGAIGTYTVSVSVTDNRPGHSPVVRSTTITVVTAQGCAQLTSPANGVVLDNGCSGMSNLLTWDFAWSASACSGATQYNIYVKHPNDATPRIDTVVNTASYHYEGYFTVDDNRLSGWHWRVRAMINGFWTDWSLERAFDVEPLNTDCTPGAPTNLSATDGRYRDRVRLTWTAPATGGAPTGYRIYRYISNISSAASEIGTSAITSYDDYVGDANTYWYWVRAYSNTGTGPYSNGNSGYRRALAQVEAGGGATLGLKSDGTVVAVGQNGYGQLNVGSWTNIVQVAEGWAYTVGLKSDGTVLGLGANTYGQLNVGSWTNIVQVAAGNTHTVGLKSDGTVVGVGDNTYGKLNVGSWTNIVQVAVGSYQTLGLKADGTVVAVGDNGKGQLNVGSWTNIVQVASELDHIVGLKSDGTVVAVGQNGYGELNVGTWTNIVQVAVGQGCSVGLKLDGTVVAIGRSNEGQLNVGSWTNIIQVAAGSYNTAGLKADGTVVAVGDNYYGQLDVGGWDLQ